MKKRRIKMRWRGEEKNGRVGWHDISGSSSGFPSCFSENSFFDGRTFLRGLVFMLLLLYWLMMSTVFWYVLAWCCWNVVSCKGNVWVLWYDMMIYKRSLLLGCLLCCKQYRKPCNVSWETVKVSKFKWENETRLWDCMHAGGRRER